MAEIPTYDARANRRGAPAVDQGDGGASTWLAIARASSAFAARIGQLADAKAEQEGYLAGLNARFQLPDPQFTEETPPQTGQRDDRAGAYNAGYGNANAPGAIIRQAAAEIGADPLDLATVISYETIGKFSTSIRGGKGGNYLGLIQFGPEEQARYGVKPGQSFAEQMKAVTAYLKDRGFKPGMGLADLYSTINAGTPGRYGASDRPGYTVSRHVAEMTRTHRKRAAQILSATGASSPGREPAGTVQPFTAEPAAGAPSPTIQPLVLTRGISIRDQAFDRAALGTAADQLDVQAYTNLEQIAAKYPGEPEKALEAIDAYASGVRGQLGAPELTQRFDSIVARHRLAIVQEQSKIAEKARRDERESAFLANWSERRTAVARLARRLPSGEEGDEAVAQEMEEMEGLLSSAQDLTPKERASLQIGLAQDVGTARIMGGFDALETPQQRMAYLDAFDEAWKEGKGAAKIVSPDVYRAIRSDMVKQINRDATAARRHAREVSGMIDSVLKRVKQGYAIPPEERAALKAQAETISDPAIAQNYALFEQLATWQATARQARPEQIAAEIAALEAQMAKGATTNGVIALETMQGLHQAVSEGLKKDPLGLASRMGLIDVPPLDPKNFAASLNQRRAIAETVAEHYRIVPRYFMAGEAEGLTRAFATEPDTILDFARELQNAMGDGDAADLLAELSKDAPLVAHAAGLNLATGNDRVLREVTEAMKRRQIEGYEPLKLASAARRTAIAGTLGPALQHMPEAEASAVQLADALFELRAQSQGIDPKEDSEDAAALYAQALQDAMGAEGETGGLGRVNGVITVIPPGLTADAIDDALALVTDADLAQLPPFGAVNGIPVRAAEIRDAKLVASGVGRYRLAQGDPSGTAPEFLATPDGDFYELDIATLLRLTQGRSLEPQSPEAGALPFGSISSPDALYRRWRAP